MDLSGSYYFHSRYDPRLLQLLHDVMYVTGARCIITHSEKGLLVWSVNICTSVGLPLTVQQSLWHELLLHRPGSRREEHNSVSAT